MYWSLWLSKIIWQKNKTLNQFLAEKNWGYSLVYKRQFFFFVFEVGYH
jgi:hypothetical protein